MFLAIEEMWQNKWRYGLILGLLTLVAYLVFFLTALANGLMMENRSGVDKWQADTIVLNDQANKILAASRLDDSQLDSITASDKAQVWQQITVAWPQDQDDDQERVAVFGLEEGSFLWPDVVNGRAPKADFEVVLDQTWFEELEMELGQELNLSGVDQAVTVVGVTDNARYNVAPMIYLTATSYKELYAQGNQPVLPNGVVIKGNLDGYDDSNLEALTMADFIDRLPGYKAQNMTFAFMIGFLILISAVIIGIFIYVLTTQKAPIFGLMKIQGLSTAYIAGSVLNQTLLLTGIGTLLGLGLTYLSGLVLPSAVPFQDNGLFYGVISAGLLGFALLGASFSVRSIVKVDPLKHIG